MELVHGVPITKYCDDNHLTPRERLELFVPVCQAIQHAHQKGIIHRDIKPSNVMVTLYDGKPVPKVIDFGVAKATEQKLTERTLFTQYGTMVGTLEYMSPEQAEMSALGVDTRSDIYSLGVLLYELLTGNTPLTHKRMKEAAYAEILRMIKEEEPPKPSTRLSDSGEALASISANRHTEPAKLTKLVRGELDWIVMKTLEKDRNRRYETAKDFAADVQRYLDDEPVQACPPSAWRIGFGSSRGGTRGLGHDRRRSPWPCWPERSSAPGRRSAATAVPSETRARSGSQLRERPRGGEADVDPRRPGGAGRRSRDGAGSSGLTKDALEFYEQLLAERSPIRRFVSPRRRRTLLSPGSAGASATRPSSNRRTSVPSTSLRGWSRSFPKTCNTVRPWPTACTMPAMGTYTHLTSGAGKMPHNGCGGRSLFRKAWCRPNRTPPMMPTFWQECCSLSAGAWTRQTSWWKRKLLTSGSSAFRSEFWRRSRTIQATCASRPAVSLASRSC